MITTGTGDLLEAEVDALVNTVNCVGIMGKGIALQFKRRYPANFKAYAAACARGEVELGKMFVFELETIAGPRWIINFPTKGHWRAKSRMRDIETGLRDLVKVIHDRGIQSIAMPPLGAGNGGLNWTDVEPVIRRALDPLDDLAVHLYEPSKQHRALEGTAQKMTWGRAVVVDLIAAYVARRHAVEPWEDQDGASALEIQKLMYFAGVYEPKLGLKFARGSYGPYSDQVRHLLQGMEGSFLHGFGDGSDRVLDLAPIAPTDAGRREAQKVRQHEEIRDSIVQPTLSAVEGFEGPYGVELLASVHWVATTEGASDPVSASDAVKSWTGRKAQLFGPKPVAEALDHLRRAGLLKTEAV